MKHSSSNPVAALLCLALFLFSAPHSLANEMPKLGSQLGEFNIALGARDPRCQSGTACFQNGAIVVQDLKGAVSSISLYWNSLNAPKSAEESRKRAERFIPKDARLLRTYTSKSGSLVDLYFSQQLAKQLPKKIPLERLDGTIAGYSDTWDGENPGTFIVLHSARHKTTIAAGNNP